MLLSTAKQTTDVFQLRALRWYYPGKPSVITGSSKVRGDVNDGSEEAEGDLKTVH